MRHHSLLTIAFLLLPAAAAAQEIEFGTKSQVGWTDNVYGTGDQATRTKDTNGDGLPDKVVDVPLTSDYSAQLSPWVLLSQPDGNLTWNLRYQPTYEYYLHESSIRGFDHDADGEVDWRVGPTTFFANEAIRQYHTVVRFNEATGNLTQTSNLQSGRDKIFGTAGQLGLRHSLTPIDLFTLTSFYNTRNYQSNNGTDNQTLGANAQFTHMMSERTTVGAALSWVQQIYSQSLGGNIVTDYYNLSGVVDHQFSRTLSLRLSAGPALVDPGTKLVNFVPKFGVKSAAGGSFIAVDANTCTTLANDTFPLQEDPNLPNYNPRVTRFGFVDCGASGSPLQSGELQALGYPHGAPLDPATTASQNVKLTEFGHPYEFDANGNLRPVGSSSVGGLDVTYFADVALTKDWEYWHATLSYDRSYDDSGSYGTSSVADTFQLALRWEPAELWTISLTGAYAMIDQVSDRAIPVRAIVTNVPAPAGVDTVSNIAAVQGLVVTVDNNALKYSTASASLAANRQLTKNSNAFVAVYWYREEQKVNLPGSQSFIPGGANGDKTSETSTWHTLSLWIGLDWHFPTYRF